MAQLHPATQLLIIQSLFLVLGVPLMAWFSVVRGRADRAARWWYAGMALSAHALILIGISTNQLSVFCLIGFIALPVSTQAIKNLMGIVPEQIGNPTSRHRQRMTAAIKQTILAAHLYGLGVSVGLVLGA